jgi:hypothetical protein
VRNSRVNEAREAPPSFFECFATISQIRSPISGKHHRDPFTRFLIATTMVNDAILGTPDPRCRGLIQGGRLLLVRSRIIFFQAAVRFPPESLSEITGAHIDPRGRSGLRDNCTDRGGVR